MIDCAGTLKVTLALFDPNSTNAKVMVMFTDGKTTAGPDPTRSQQPPARTASSSTASA